MDNLLTNEIPAEALRLLAFVNSHDYGVYPTGVLNSDNSITVRIAAGDLIDIEVVRTLHEACNALGY